ncbi:hypothetical protein LO763_06630 [Glycomyces sp. A-F 0318]|uniref:SSI family serine proteinase inhibitor n=1 Tax=Glycomyces amatae TaxID=2881355 RepID=UPI001E2CDED0|nr:SSI family serine proteinase inhibitor [Glycomyces amatae]MCD0443300.1 hypothetical protein [Glycomyces amatae]
MKLFSAGAAIAAAAALVALGSGPAQAEQAPAEPENTGLVFLSVERGGDRGDAMVLPCPEGTGHAQGLAACAQLAAADGDFRALPEVDGVCTKEYAPVVFQAAGIWEGEFVLYKQEFANYCTGLHATGGAVFDLG